MKTEVHRKIESIMFRLLWAAAHSTRDLMRWAPTNRLLGFLRTRQGLKWGVPAMLLGVAYLFAAATCTTAADLPGSGWLYLFTALFVYDGFKFVFFGPASLFLLLRARTRDRRYGRASTGR
jgi:hypothetical protein